MVLVEGKLVEIVWLWGMVLYVFWWFYCCICVFVCFFSCCGWCGLVCIMLYDEIENYDVGCGGRSWFVFGFGCCLFYSMDDFCDIEFVGYYCGVYGFDFVFGCFGNGLVCVDFV